MLGRASGRHLHALAHNRDPRPVAASAGGGARSGSQRALGRSADSRRPTSTPSLVALVDRVTRRMRAAGRVGRTVIAAAALRRLHPGHPVAHPAPGDGPAPGRSWPPPGRLLADGHAADRARRASPWSGVAVANLDDDGAVQLALPFDRGGRRRLDAALDDVRERFGSAPLTRAVCSAGTGLRSLLPDCAWPD